MKPKGSSKPGRKRKGKVEKTGNEKRERAGRRRRGRDGMEGKEIRRGVKRENNLESK